MSLPALVLAVAAAAVPSFEIDLGHYFASEGVEQSERVDLMAHVDAFVRRSAPATPAALLELLHAHDALSRDLRLHQIYVHVRAERDVDDHAAAAADAALDVVQEQLDVGLQHALTPLGRAAADRLASGDPALREYRYLIDSTFRQGALSSVDERALALLAKPTLDSLGNAYGELRREVRRTAAATPAIAASTPALAYASKWAPYLANEPAFAALLAPIVTLQDGVAQLQGFGNAAEAAYARQQLSTLQVHSVLAAIRQSTSYARYANVLADAAARQLRVDPAQIRPWDLAAADTWQPPHIAFGDAVPLILDAVRPMGLEYAGHFDRLFDPANRRVDLCISDPCDDTGFSIGGAGLPSALFYGHFDGETNSLRAVAHEAGHAVHHQFMGENQPLEAYNEGPHFLFESFAIFNELLFLDHMQRTAPTRAARARYLHQFLDDATFQVFGSAQETSLEESFYAHARDGHARSAADFDALALASIAAFLPPPRRSPEMKAAWAMNRLYFIDPFYDLNYLFAGLLALDYLSRFERDPADFRTRYVALLKNGFDDTPTALLHRFLGIDLDNGSSLVRDVMQLIDSRTSTLQALYADGAGFSACVDR
jgi:oligoendopeptidase F